MILDLAVLHPWCKIPHFPVVPVVRQPHLGADMQDLVVVDDHSTIIDDILVHDWPVTPASDRATS